MKDRRSLIEGLKGHDATLKEKEQAFIYGTTDSAVEAVQVPAEPPPAFDSKVLPQFAGRVPVTTRTRPEVATALKRASLTRQLNGIEPYYVQDIMEEALETWLKSNGYLT